MLVGGVFVAVDSTLGAVSCWSRRRDDWFDPKQRRKNCPSMGERQSRFAGFLGVEDWTPRNETLLDAVVKQANTITHLWLVACDANMCPEDFENGLWFRK